MTIWSSCKIAPDTTWTDVPSPGNGSPGNGDDGLYPGEESTCILLPPDMLLIESPATGTEIFSRRTQWDPNETVSYMSSLGIQIAGAEYDVTLTQREGECNGARHKRFVVNALNTGATKRVQLLYYIDETTVQTTYVDVDITATLADGEPHWLSVEVTPSGGDVVGIRLWLDDTSLADDIEFGDVSDFTEFSSTNTVPTITPYQMWQSSQSAWDCITSGSYTGPGGITKLPQVAQFGWLDESDVDINLYADNRIATGVIGPASRRAGYADHTLITDKRYWEIYRGSTNCTAGADLSVGGNAAGLNLGTNFPGQVANSWGGVLDGGRIFINGATIASGFTSGVNFLFALDGATGDLWMGLCDRVGAGVVWYSSAVPGVDAAALNIFTQGTPVSPYQTRISFSMFTTGDALEIWSSESTCLVALPTGFNYM